MSGALVHIENNSDSQHMNWLREAGHWDRRGWKPDVSSGVTKSDGQWGLVETAQTGLLHVGKVQRMSDRAWEAVYMSGTLTVAIRRELDVNGDLAESYTFKNTGVVDLELPLGSISIAAPFFDQHPDAQEKLMKRCHAHIWAGGNSACVDAMRMGAASPHSPPAVDRDNATTRGPTTRTGLWSTCSRFARSSIPRK